MVINQYGEVVTNASGQQLIIEPTAPDAAASGGWMTSLVDAFTAISGGYQKTQIEQARAAAAAQQQGGMPQWVWLALPAGIGAIVLALALSSGRRAPAMAGYRRRTRRRRR